MRSFCCLPAGGLLVAALLCWLACLPESGSTACGSTELLDQSAACLATLPDYSPSCPPFNELGELGDCYCKAHADQETVTSWRPLLFNCDLQNQNARTLDVRKYDTVCLRRTAINEVTLDPAIKSVFLTDIYIGNLTIKDTTEPGGMALTCRNCSMKLLPQFTEITLKNSQVTFLKDKRQLDLIHLQASHVREMRNLSGLVRFKQHDCPNNQFNPLLSKPSSEMDISLVFYQAQFTHSLITRIDNTIVSNLKIDSSTIFTIYPSGLQVLRGPVVLSHVRIHHLHRGALVTSSSLVYMEHIDIAQCDEPCIIVTNDLVHLKDVTIGGRNVNDTHDIAFGEQLRMSFRETISDELPGYCNIVQEGKKSVVVCSLEDYEDGTPLEMILHSSPLAPSIRVANQFDIDIVEGCYSHVTLQNITGYYRDFHSVGRQGLDECHQPVLLTMQNVTLKTLYSRTISRLAMERTNIVTLDLPVVNSMQTMNTRIGTIENMKFTRLTPTDALVFSEGSIRKIDNIKLKSGAFFNKLHINEIQILTIDHLHSTTEMRETIIDSISTNGGIRIINGVLLLSNVEITGKMDERIRLETGGTLLMDKIQPALCPENTTTISALARYQVVYEEGLTPHWLWSCIQVREIGHIDALMGRSFPPLSYKAYQLLRPSDCTERGPGLLECNQKGKQVGILLGESNYLDAYREVTVSDVQELFIGEHCFNKIRIIDSSCKEMRRVNSCFYNLEVIISKVNLITNRIWKLSIFQSTVVELDPSTKMHIMNIRNSNLTRMHAVTDDGQLLMSKVDHVMRLHVSDHMKIEDSTISLVKKEGIVVEYNAKMIIENSTIESLEPQAITVFGSLTVQKVNFNRGAMGSIVIGQQAKLIFRDVSFSDCVVNASGRVQGSFIQMDGFIVENFMGELLRRVRVAGDDCELFPYELEGVVTTVESVVNLPLDDATSTDQEAHPSLPYYWVVIISCASSLVVCFAFTYICARVFRSIDLKKVLKMRKGYRRFKNEDGYCGQEMKDLSSGDTQPVDEAEAAENSESEAANSEDEAAQNSEAGDVPDVTPLLSTSDK